jgi:hypothetical protein
MSYTIQIWHAKVPTFSEAPSRSGCISTTHMNVATLTSSKACTLFALEDAFAKSQNIDDLDWKCPNRPSCVGDILYVENIGAAYEIAHIGYNYLAEVYIPEKVA